MATLSGVGQRQLTQCVGSLPPALELAEAYEAWHQLYVLRSQHQGMRIRVAQSDGHRFSEAEFRDRASQLTQELNVWLNSPTFQQIDRTLRTELSRQDDVQIILETQDYQLKRLPWQQWNFLEDYPQAEVALSALAWQDRSGHHPSHNHVRILGILGEDDQIDTAVDGTALAQLPHAEVTLLRNPSHAQLTQQLWDPQGWDILCFSGHSQTIDAQGYLYLNGSESLSISQIKHALARAIEGGLKVAIFNSCDGFGLAEQLADLHIPYGIVMREPVPDPVAQLFLSQFLQSFSQNIPLHLAVRAARQRLEALESQWPCASWLPTLWQNPTADPLQWQDLYRATADLEALPEGVAPKRRWALQPLLLCSLLATGLSMGVRSLGYLEPFELFAYDHLIQQRPLETPDPRLLVVEITQADTQTYGYPVSDEVLATFIATLQRYEPRAIGMDIHRSKPLIEGETALIDQFLSSRNFFWVCSYQAMDEHYAPPAAAAGDKLINQVGFSDLLVDGEPAAVPDGRNDVTGGDPFLNAGLTVRRQLLSYTPDLAPTPSTCGTPYSLSFQLAYEFLSQAEVSPLTVNADQFWQFGSVAFPALPSRFGGYQSLGGQSSQILINYRANQPGQRIALSQLINGDVDPALIRDRIVLIGYTSPIARDDFQTPYGPMPGVWIHGHMTSQLISAVLDDRPLIWTLPQWRWLQWGDGVWVLGWSLIGSTLLVWLSPCHLYQGLAWGGLIIGLYGVSMGVILLGGWLPLIPTCLALGLVWGIQGIQKRLP
ncbi:MAG: CHASE2 domain-containing protein [Leptolyngbya sp. RL_3_1]|nr:CHASE2 domain-containing protein [Leptolyngbya sp. RL_3_1]